MLATLLLTVVALTGPDPLTPSQATRLETARDGGDHREAAFLALAESFAGWDGAIGDAPVRLAPDLDAMLADPPAYRGDLCRVRGVIQQTATLEPPYDVASEWFLRTSDGRPILVYVVDPGPLPEAARRPGREVAIVARFYKRVELVARDGVRRAYPAFVGSMPVAVGRASGGAERMWIVAAAVLGLAVVFTVVLVATRRARRSSGRTRPAWSAAPDDDDQALPDDPADALAELRRRAGRERSVSRDAADNGVGTDLA